MVAEDGFENCPSPAPAASRIIATLVRSGVICLEQFEPLYADAKLEGCKAGSVASRMSQAVNYSPAGPSSGGSYPTMLWAALCITASSGCRCPLYPRKRTFVGMTAMYRTYELL